MRIFNPSTPPWPLGVPYGIVADVPVPYCIGHDLIEEAALKLAEQECLADEEVRARRRVREAERREKEDREYIRQFSGAILDLYPKCPARTAKTRLMTPGTILA